MVEDCGESPRSGIFKKPMLSSKAPWRCFQALRNDALTLALIKMPEICPPTKCSTQGRPNAASYTSPHLHSCNNDMFRLSYGDRRFVVIYGSTLSTEQPQSTLLLRSLVIFLDPKYRACAHGGVSQNESCRLAPNPRPEMTSLWGSRIGVP